MSIVPLSYPSPGPADKLLAPSHPEHVFKVGAEFLTTGYVNVIGFCSWLYFLFFHRSRSGLCFFARSAFIALDVVGITLSPLRPTWFLKFAIHEGFWPARIRLTYNTHVLQFWNNNCLNFWRQYCRNKGYYQ